MNALEAIKRPRVDVKDPKAIEMRIKEYLHYCLENDLIPGVVACSNWLGINYQTLTQWYDGTRGTPEHQRVAARFFGIVQDCWQQNMDADNINNITGMFVGKAFYGYKDTQEITVTHTVKNDISNAELLAESKLLPGAERVITDDNARVIDAEIKQIAQKEADEVPP